MTLIDTLLPLFLLIALGFGAIRAGVVAAGAVPALGALVIRLALPALVFLALSRRPPAEVFEPTLFTAYAVGSLATMGLCVMVARALLGLGRAETAVVAIGVSMANSGFMGFPIGQAVLGAETAATVLAHTMLVENLVILPLGLMLLARAQSAQGAGQGLAGALLRNPLIIAIVAGVALATTGLHLPGVIRGVLDLLAQLAAPLALLVIGGMLASTPGGGARVPVVLILAGKLALHPLAVWAALLAMPGAPSPLAGAGVLFASMPMVTIFPLLCAPAGAAAGRLAALALMVATLGSFATLPLVIMLLGLAQGVAP